ncbi:hypothetical protein BLOT_000143 [Blomia tropicalis]|nr:hypothetical protein BLOT_000143 [Blomia tropicalis]
MTNGYIHLKEIVKHRKKDELLLRTDDIDHTRTINVAIVNQQRIECVELANGINPDVVNNGAQN